MWVARPSRRSALAKADVLGRSDGYMRRRTCQTCKAVNSKKLLPALVLKQVAFAMLLVAVHARRSRDLSRACMLRPRRCFSCFFAQ